MIEDVLCEPTGLNLGPISTESTPGVGRTRWWWCLCYKAADGGDVTERLRRFVLQKLMDLGIKVYQRALVLPSAATKPPVKSLEHR